MKEIITEQSLIALRGLPNMSKYPYAGTPGQGHPDEEMIVRLLAGKHWVQMKYLELEEVSHEIFCVKNEDAVRLLPAFAKAIYFGGIPEGRYPLYSLMESVQFGWAPSSDGSKAEVYREIIDALPDDQRRAMYEVVRSFFWEKFTPGPYSPVPDVNYSISDGVTEEDIAFWTID